MRNNHSTKTAWLPAILLLALALAAATQTPAATPAPDPIPTPAYETLDDRQVLQSIRRGVDFLLKDLDQKMKPLGDLPDTKRAEPNIIPSGSGEFTLELYALLHVGRDLLDPRLHFRAPGMQSPVDILLRENVDETYTTALQSLALAELPQLPEVQKAIALAARRLTAGTGKAGGYTYTLNSPSRDTHDQSNSQYGLLGVWAAADWGIDVPSRYWRDTDDFWRSIQTPSGGWGYGAGGPSEPATPSMTAAGVASLFVCKEFLDRTPQPEPKPDPALDNGFASLIKTFDPASTNLYYLYGVERVGLASGHKFLGASNWYRQAAAHLLHMQQPDGSFNASFTGANAVRSTCYALLFLVRGRAPVVMNKLEYNGPWDARPRDSANVHAKLARMLEKHLNWQSVPLAAPYEEWLDAPLLFITGSKDPAFTPDDIAKLRQFVNAGGIVFSVTQGNSQEFSDAMQKYALQMGPPSANYRRLPPDHPLFTVYTRPKTTPELYAITNGIRELWIQSPTDYSALWQARRDPRTDAQKDAWDLPADLLFYAAGKSGLRSKLESLLVPAPPPAPPQPARELHMVRIQFAGNWNPEPAAWDRLAKIMALHAHTNLSIQNLRASNLGTLPDRPQLVHLAGTGKLTLTPEERQALRVYVLSGGTLFIEAMAGDHQFAQSAIELLPTLFPDAKLRTVPANYLLYNGSFSPDALKIDTVDYRKSWILKNGPFTQPRLRYLTIDNRVAVLFSPDDITSGLLGTNTWGIDGYTPDSATALARNILLFASINAPKNPTHDP